MIYDRRTRGCFKAATAKLFRRPAQKISGSSLPENGDIFRAEIFRAESSVLNRSVFRFDRADGAAVFTGSAIDADIRIDLILRVSLRNRVHRASIRASAAGNAIFRNFVRHDLLPPNRLYGTSRGYYYIITRKNSKGFLRRFSDFFENFLGGMFQGATVSRAVLSKRDRRVRLSLPFPACRPFRPL